MTRLFVVLRMWRRGSEQNYGFEGIELGSIIWSELKGDLDGLLILIDI
jgi:hypothetical protein